MTQDETRYIVGRPDSISYGPTGANVDAWELRFSTDRDERIVVRLDRADMYELWMEVRGVTGLTVHNDPECRECVELVHEIVSRASVASEAELREALDALGGDER